MALVVAVLLAVFVLVELRVKTPMAVSERTASMLSSFMVSSTAATSASTARRCMCSR